MWIKMSFLKRDCQFEYIFSFYIFFIIICLLLSKPNLKREVFFLLVWRRILCRQKTKRRKRNATHKRNKEKNFLLLSGKNKLKEHLTRFLNFFSSRSSAPVFRIVSLFQRIRILMEPFFFLSLITLKKANDNIVNDI